MNKQQLKSYVVEGGPIVAVMLLGWAAHWLAYACELAEWGVK